MKQMFRMMMVPCVAVVTAVTAWAAPNPKWVPANADFAFTADGVNVQNAEAEKVWREGLEKIGIPVESPTAIIKQIDAQNSGISSTIKELLGANDDFTALSLVSVTGSLSIDKADLTKDTCTNSFITVALENPKADLAKLEAAIKQAISHPNASECKITLVREKDWLVFREKDGDENDGFIGICQVPEGYLITLQPSMERAEAARTCAVKPIAAGNPLMAAFAPKAEGVDSSCIYMVKSLSELLKRYMKADDLARLAASYPPAPQTKAIAFSVTVHGTTTDIKLTINTETEAAAQQTLEAFLGYKMLAQMMGPSMVGKPDSKLIAFISSISCKTEGKAAVISCTVTPEVIFPIIAEIQEMQKQAAAFANYADDEDDFDLDLDLDEEDEDEPLSPEEAKAILDALDVE